jgi:hypothetical protein
MLKRKGGYPGNRRYPIKFHASPDLRMALLNLAENRKTAMACVVRELVEKALKDEQPLPLSFGSRTDGS